MSALPQEIEPVRTRAEQQAIAMRQDADQLQIATVADRKSAESMVSGLKALEDDIKEHYRPLKKAADDAHKLLVKSEKDSLEPVNEARKLIKAKCIAWDDEQERLRQEEERRLQEIAQKQAEEEALAMAAQAEAEGDTDYAEAIIGEPVVVAPVAVPRVSPPPSRLTAARSSWDANVYDLMALVRHVAENPHLVNYLSANTTALNGLAKSLKRTDLNLPGVRGVETRK